MTLRLTYKAVFDAVEHLENQNLNCQNHLPQLIKNIDSDFILPTKISNFIRKCRKFKENGGNIDDLITCDAKPIDLGPFCSKAGLILKDLNDPHSVLSVKQELITNGLVYELEKQRRLSAYSWVVAKQWMVRLNSEYDTSSNLSSLTTSWNGIYNKVTSMRKQHQTVKLDEFMTQIYDPPMSRETHVVNQLAKATLPEQREILETYHHQIETQVKRRDSALKEARKQLVEVKGEVHLKNMEISEVNALVQSKIHILDEKNCQIEALHVDTQLSENREKLSSYTPRNVDRCEETKLKSIEKLKKELKYSDTKRVDYEKELTVKDKENSLALAMKDENINSMNSAMQESTLKVDELKKDKLRLQKRASKLKMKVIGNNNTKSGEVTELQENILFLENENQILKEQIETFLQDRKIKTFQNGKYNDNIRTLYMDLISANVSIKNCEFVIRSVLNNLGERDIERLPQKSVAAIMMTEAAALAKIQAGVALKEQSNNTLHFDGSLKNFKDYAAYDVTTGDGQSLALGYLEIPDGTTDSYLGAARDLLYEIASLLLPNNSTALEKDSEVAKMLESFKNTMSDRHVVNKCFNEQFSKWRDNFLPLVHDNVNSLNQEQLETVTRMNHTFCGAHVIINMGTVAKEFLKEYEEIAAEDVVRSGFSTSNARTYDILFELSKALTSAHGYQKAGAFHYWKPYLDERHIQNHFISFRGERINVIFVIAGAAYYHRKHVLDFIQNHSVQHNALLTALLDMSDKLYLSAFRALGILGKLLTGPLFRLLSDNKHHIFALNNTWETIRNTLIELSQNAKPLLEQKPVFIDADVDKDEVYTALFDETDDETEVLTEHCLQMLCCALEILITRQLADQLPGGKYYLPSQEVMRETQYVPKTNLITERDFAYLDRKLSEKPNISTISLTGSVLFLNNKTRLWLDSLTEGDRANYIQKSRTEALKLIKKYRQNAKSVSDARKEKMKDIKVKKDKLQSKKDSAKEEITARISEHGGLWRSKDEVTSNLNGLSEKERHTIISDQIRFRKSVLKNKCVDKSLLQLSVAKKKFSSEQLQKNLSTLLESNPSSSESSPNNPKQVSTLRSAEVRRVLTEKAIKRKQSLKNESSIPRTKKAKLIDFTGKRIQHRWETDGKPEWWSGIVRKALGKAGDPECEYEVVYDRDPENVFSVALAEDYSARDLLILI